MNLKKLALTLLFRMYSEDSDMYSVLVTHEESGLYEGFNLNDILSQLSSEDYESIRTIDDSLIGVKDSIKSLINTK